MESLLVVLIFTTLFFYGMELCKCLFEARGESVCAESGGKLIKLSDCKSSIDDSLRKLNVLGYFQGQLLEYDLILDRSGLAHDFSFDQLERLWICEKHRNDMGKYWRPRQTCQYPLHRPGPKKKLRTRNAVHASMSREINLIFGKNVPIGSREYNLYFAQVTFCLKLLCIFAETCLREGARKVACKYII